MATDQQGNGHRLPVLWPCCGGGRRPNFFQVNGVGPDHGLIQRRASTGQRSPTRSGRSPAASNFAVNPLNGDQIIMSSQAGRIFRTEDQG